MSIDATIQRLTLEDIAELQAYKAELESRRVDDIEPPRRKAKKRKAAAANKKNGKAQDNHATAKTPTGGTAAIVFSHEPLSIEEWKRLRKTLARPDNIPANARSP